MRRVVSSLLLLAGVVPAALAAQESRPTFRAEVDRVTLSVTVRTQRGKPVTSLGPSDFMLYDSGEPRAIAEFRTDTMPISLGFLVDFSGSMGVGERRQAARDGVQMLLSRLATGSDNAGLYVFDRTFRVLQPLAPAPGDILAQLDNIGRPYGATSLFDAIAETGRLLAEHAGSKRAVIALTDGADNASRLTPAEVSGLASSIDVPVYVMIVVSPFDRVGNVALDQAALTQLVQGPLGNLARWTGGEIYAALGPASSSRVADQIVSELRQQYLIAFEPDRRPGWHVIDLRTRRKDLIVRTRSGYFVRDEPTQAW